MNRNNSLSGAEIFIKRAEKKLQAAGAQSPKVKRRLSGRIFKSAGIVACMSIVFFGINLSSAGIQNIDKQVVDTASNLPQGTTLKSMLPQVQTPTFDTVQPATVVPAANTNTFIPNSGTGFTTTPTFNTPTFNTPTFNTPTFGGPFVNPVQNTGPTGGGVSDISAAANQVNQLQNQIVQQMQACLQLTAQAQGQINQLKGQVAQIDSAIQQINAQMNGVNYSDPNAQSIRFQLQAQRDQLQFQKNQINSAITQVRNQYYSGKSQCQSSISRMQSSKRTLESQITTAYNNALNVRVY